MPPPPPPDPLTLRPRQVSNQGKKYPPPPPSRDAVEGKGPQRQPQNRAHRGWEEVAKAVGGGYCRLQMPLKLALTVAGHRPGAPPGGGGGLTPSPSSKASLPPPSPKAFGHCYLDGEDELHRLRGCPPPQWPQADGLQRRARGQSRGRGHFAVDRSRSHTTPPPQSLPASLCDRTSWRPSCTPSRLPPLRRRTPPRTPRPSPSRGPPTASCSRTACAKPCACSRPL